jgi:choline dehydrogenase-like flavoprotein
MPRMRVSDFGAVATEDGVSPAWPISYPDIELFYARADELYCVHGDDSDPAGPWRSSPYQFPPIAHQSPIARIAQRLEQRAHAALAPVGR